MNATHPESTSLRGGETVLLEAAGVADAHGVAAAPGALLLSLSGGGAVVLAAGEPGMVGRHPAALGASRITMPDDVLIPGLVNAHTHLDLTHIGPVPFDPAQGFASWAEIVIKGRALDEGAIRASVREGIRRSLAGGVVAVGDIGGVGRAEALEELRASALLGVCFVEWFGFGEAGARSAEAARAMVSRDVSGGGAPPDTPPQMPPRVRLGLSPHAPYSVGAALYEALAAIASDAARSGATIPLCTHLAESPEEREFVSAGTGTMRDLAERLGVWSDATARDVGRGLHPIERLRHMLERRPMLIAHANDCPDEGLRAIASSGSSVVWCPRGHAYFGRAAAFGPHRWKEMLAAGITVCLGTDSIINLPPDESDRLSPLDEARHLWRGGERDGALLLRLITTNGAKALGLAPDLFTFAPGPIAGVAAERIPGGASDRAADPRSAVMASASPPRLVVVGGRLVSPEGALA